MQLLTAITFLATSWVVLGKLGALTAIRSMIWKEKKMRSYHDTKGGKLYVDTKNSHEDDILDDAVMRAARDTKSKVRMQKK